MIDIIFADCLSVLDKLEGNKFNLIYIDPPFNTNKVQKRGNISYSDKFGKTSGTDQEQMNYENFIKSVCSKLYLKLTTNGSFFIQADYREIHYIKVWLDGIFGRASFMNEIIWAYDYGGRSKNKWAAKHDTILWYAKDPKNYIFNYDKMDRIPYAAPSLCGPEKAKLGKCPTDVWQLTIVHTNGKEKTGYPTQKPKTILDRIIKVHSNPGNNILDVFAGSGTTGERAELLGRHSVLVDNNPQAIKIMQDRFDKDKLPYSIISTDSSHISNLNCS